MSQPLVPTSSWKDIPMELWTDHVFQFLFHSEIFSIIRLVSHDWNSYVIHQMRNCFLQLKLNRIHLPSFLICCKELYFTNIGKLDLKFVEYAMEPKYQKPVDESETKEITESFNPLEYFPNLSAIKVSITDEKVISLISPQIVNKKYLNDLDIRSNSLTVNSLENILNLENITMNLTRLDLSVNRLSYKTIDLICSSSHLSNLKYLNICHNHLLSFTPTGEISFRDSLEELHVSDCFTSVKSLESFNIILISFPKLTVLDFSFNRLSKFSKMYRKVNEENNLDKYCKLTKLNLSGSKIRNDDLEFIAKMPIFAQLTYLDLSRNKINKIGTEKLADHTSVLTKLEYLDLSRCGIGNEGADNIRNGSIFSSLKTLIE